MSYKNFLLFFVLPRLHQKRACWMMNTRIYNIYTCTCIHCITAYNPNISNSFFSASYYVLRTIFLCVYHPVIRYFSFDTSISNKYQQCPYAIFGGWWSSDPSMHCHFYQCILQVQRISSYVYCFMNNIDDSRIFSRYQYMFSKSWIV